MVRLKRDGCTGRAVGKTVTMQVAELPAAGADAGWLPVRWTNRTHMVVLKRTLHICWWTFASAIVAVAVMLSAARLLLPAVSEYRDEVARIAADVFGRPVKIGSLDAAWRMLSPVIRMRDVTVEDPRLPDGRLTVEKVDVAVDVWRSLLQGELQTAGVRVIGTQLDMQTDVRNSPGNFPLMVVVEWLLGQDSIALEQVQLRWRDPGLFDTPVQLSDLSAKLVNTGRRHQLLLEARLPAPLGESLKVAADLRGSRNDFSGWRGTLYLKAGDLQVAALGPALADLQLSARGSADLELWVGVDGATPVWGRGDLGWTEPGLYRSGDGDGGLHADRLSGQFSWRHRNDRWRIGVSRFELRRDGRVVWPESEFDFFVQTGDQPLLRGQASQLVLNELAALAPLLPRTYDDRLAVLDRLRPRGLVRDAELEWAGRGDDESRLALRAAIENLALAPDGAIPGVVGVSGRIEGDLETGTLQLDTSQAELLMPRVFSQPLMLSGLRGEIVWQRFRDRYRLETRRMYAESGPLSLVSRWQMDWADGQTAPWLDLQLAAGSVPLSAVGDYLPARVMPGAAVDWLRQAFRAGTARNARVLVQGPVDQMPFDAGQGRFEASFDFLDASLDFGEGWGRMDDLDGHGRFVGRSMDITAKSARIEDSLVERAVAVIADLTRPVLKIDGTVSGTVEGMLAYLEHSPLRDKFGELVGNVHTTGDARLQLHLDIPLKHALGQPRVKGKVAFAGNSIGSGQSNFDLTDVHATLHFTETGASVENGKARLLGQPVAVSVFKQGGEEGDATVVDIQGDLKLVDYARKEQLPLAAYLEGAAPWQVQLVIPDRKQPGLAPVNVEIRSDLRGIAVALPPPFGKSSGETRPLSVHWAPRADAQQPVQVSYGNDIRASALPLRDAGGLRKLALHFGDRVPGLPKQDQVKVTGHLQRFDLDGWLPVFTDLGDTGGGGISPGLDISAGVFRFGGAEVRDIRVLSDHVDPWYFNIEGKGAKGWLRWVPGGAVLPRQLLAQMEYLKVDSPDAAAVSSASNVSPGQLPHLNIEIDDLHWGTRDFGRLGLVSRAVDDGVHFETLTLDSAAIVFEGSGDWTEHDNVQTTRFDVTVTGGELEKLGAWLGSSGVVKGGKLSGTAKCGWKGSPAAFSLSGLEGEIDLKARDGRLEDVKEGAGKLLSLVSLNSLQRRLSLDFRDVVKEGFSFDVMKGKFVIEDGNAYTDDFTIEGTSVNIEVSGRTGLVAHDYDQLVTVTPQVSSTLPIAGAIAGGPAVGAAVFLADKLVGDRVNRLTSVRYHVTGSWDKPVYSRLKKDKAKPQPEHGRRE
jgi:uncharacterized protein (TIGR02099 family)